MTPQLGARKKSKQAKTTDLISSNKAESAPDATAGDGGGATGGNGTSFNGLDVVASSGAVGTASNCLSAGIGGGAAFVAGRSAVPDNTTISGNRASRSDNDVVDTFSG